MPQALQIHAGPLARAHLRERGLQPQDIRAVAAAAGGPKGLILLPLDQFIFGQWLPQGRHAVDLIGASIGAWRMAAACSPDPVAAFERLGHDYIHERYQAVPDADTAPAPQPTGLPDAATVTARFAWTLHQHFATTLQSVLTHPHWSLHMVVAQGRGPLRRPGRWRLPLGFAAAVAANALSPRVLGTCLGGLWFSSTGRQPDWMNAHGRHTPVALTAANFEPALLASCTIPFWLNPVVDIPGAPAGPCWDGGLVEYHMHLPYARMAEGLALIPHFQPSLVPGWLDKAFKRRHRATPALDRAIVLSPHPDWVAQLPGGKIPDRSDFKRHLHDPAQRERLWQQALQASRQLADEWANCLQRPSIESLPLP